MLSNKNTITSPRKIPAVKHSLSFHSFFVLSRVKNASQWLVKEEGRGGVAAYLLNHGLQQNKVRFLITLYLPVVQYQTPELALYEMEIIVD